MKERKEKEEEEEVVDHSFFNLRLKSAFVSLHYQLSPAALQQHPSIFTIDFRFLFSNSSFQNFYLEFEGILLEYIQNILLLIYIS